MTTKGALYMVWEGEDTRAEQALPRAIESLQKWHPELPFHVERLPEGSTLLDKARMADLTPYDLTVFLDADTVVLGRLDYGFNAADAHGLACCVCECPWARRFTALKDYGDIVEYNTGVLFFDANDWPARQLFDTWKDEAMRIDPSLVFNGSNGPTVMPINDQASFALAVHKQRFNPFVLPMNWNFRPLWQNTVFGPIKIWHDYQQVHAAVNDWNASQEALITCGRFA